MFNIIFPPGCYGHYVASVLYCHTNLNQTNSLIKFDKNGSSHKFTEIDYKNFLKLGHLRDFNKDDLQHLSVVIIPENNHYLDYFDNQFSKEENYNFKNFITKLFLDSSIEKNLSNWNKSKILDNWEIREWLSYCITDILNASYLQSNYQKLNGSSVLYTKDIFFTDIFLKKIKEISKLLNLEFLTTEQDFNYYHNTFLKVQKFYNIQNFCDQWITDIINKKSSFNPCLTIFDEAYVQSKLRALGYEIKCYKLNEFPKNALEMHFLLIPN